MEVIVIFAPSLKGVPFCHVKALKNKIMYALEEIILPLNPNTQSIIWEFHLMYSQILLTLPKTCCRIFQPEARKCLKVTVLEVII